MRDLVRKIVSDYKSPKLEGQDEGYVVFRGEEPDTQQAVSIKILPRLLGKDPQIEQRFRGLSQAIRQLNHPNIASIRKVGDEAGLPYLITRILEKAQPLTVKLNQPWAVDAAADVVMQLGQALEHAYNKGVLHGSLTPENIMIEDNGRVVISDFGLTELQDLLGVQLKQAASPFLSPERVAGSPADASADVYSLAAILYSMLAKRPPQVVKGEVLPPSRFNPDVPPAMDAVVVKALAQDPAQRYPDVKSFLAAFGAVTLVPAAAKAEPVAADSGCPRCGAQNQSGKFCRKCGARLTRPKERVPERARSLLDEPIQVTEVTMGNMRIEVGSGVDVRDTVIAQPMAVVAGESLAEFPEPLEVPRIDLQRLWPTVDGQAMITMPEPPAMPTIDWAEIAPPMPDVPTMEDIPVSSEGD